MTLEDVRKMIPEQLKELVASMFNPVKICDNYLPSKVHNDIIRRANPTWSEKALSSYRIRNESQYLRAIELEKSCQYKTDSWNFHRCSKQFKSECISGLNAFNIKLASGIGITPEESLQKAKEHAVYFIERDLLVLANEIPPEHVFWHIPFADRYRSGKRPDILDEIDAWHKDAKNVELHEYLGLTKEQYARWVEDPSSIDKL